ncbi:MAG: type II toxin-antitoxin system toxin DNA ADP-ribosyl transferase DarT [Pseudonocardiaceae bacterium]
MPRPVPTPVYHFTPIAHLATIIEHGLLCDTQAVALGLRSIDVGNRDIKAQRRHRAVRAGPRGMIADYTPFYFAPRSPMMSAIHHGKVPEYTSGTESLVYLVTTVERLVELDLSVVFTDRNAVLRHAHHTTDPGELDEIIDWDLMAARIWRDTDAEPDRRERRMAECLVHRRVPWEAIKCIATCGLAQTTETQRMLTHFRQRVPVRTKPDWYFT